MGRSATQVKEGVMESILIYVYAQICGILL